MAITLKAFHFVMYSLLIYSSFRDKLNRIAAEDPAELGRKVNRIGAEERNILILNERLSDTSSSRERFKREAGRTYDAGKAESHTTVDDEDSELEENAELGGGDSMQGDEPALSPNNGDQNLDAPQSEINTTSVHVIATSKTSTANAHVNVLVSTTASLTTLPEAVSTSSVHGANTTTATITTTMPIFITSHATTDKPNTIDIEASVFSSVKSTFITTIIISSRHNTRASTQLSTVGVSGASTALPSALPTTSETSTKGNNNVQNQREPSPKPKEKKTLFGFVTIEILVALLAGAACAVILLIFLVHRLKKRNEGSYELQETLMLKSGGYAEEKEVFV